MKQLLNVGRYDTQKQTGWYGHGGKLTLTRIQTISCCDIMLNLQQGTNDLEPVIAISQSLSSPDNS